MFPKTGIRYPPEKKRIYVCLDSNPESSALTGLSYTILNKGTGARRRYAWWAKSAVCFCGWCSRSERSCILIALASGPYVLTASREYHSRVMSGAQVMKRKLIIAANTVLLLTFRQVLQTFACEDLPEIGKRYLRADFSVECDTATHRAYQIYAAFMIALCECTPAHLRKIQRV